MSRNSFSKIGSTARFGYFYPLHRLGPVRSFFEVSGQFAQIQQFIGRKSFYALPVYAGRPGFYQ